jgi:hypothetical protein
MVGKIGKESTFWRLVMTVGKTTVFNFVCLALMISFVSWLFFGIVIINPFITVLGMVACPFFYFMLRKKK